MAGLAAPLFGPVTAVTITCSVIPVLRTMHIVTFGSPSGTVTSGTMTLTSGTVSYKNRNCDGLVNSVMITQERVRIYFVNQERSSYFQLLLSSYVAA